MPNSLATYRVRSHTLPNLVLNNFYVSSLSVELISVWYIRCGVITFLQHLRFFILVPLSGISFSPLSCSVCNRANATSKSFLPIWEMPQKCRVQFTSILFDPKPPCLTHGCPLIWFLCFAYVTLDDWKILLFRPKKESLARIVQRTWSNCILLCTIIQCPFHLVSCTLWRCL
jgi:hypothetical protein